MIRATRAAAAVVAAFCFLLAVSVAGEVKTGEYVNDNFLRTLYIDGRNVRATYTIKTTVPDKKSPYLVYVPRDKPIYHVAAVLNANPVEVEQFLDTDLDQQIIKLVIPEEFKPKDPLSLVVTMVFPHSYVAFPKEVPQGQQQSFIFNTTAYASSPYLTKKQKLMIKTGGKQVKSYSETPGNVQKGDVLISYGEYENIESQQSLAIVSDGDAANSNPLVSVHLVNTNTPLTATMYKRYIEVSHWGDACSFEDHIDLRHDGALLHGQYSRVDAQMNRKPLDNTGVENHFEVKIPRSAYEVYYRDLVGNVTTSHLSQRGNFQLLELRPRFPMFGGWRYQWHHGYTQPLHEVLRIHAKDTYILKVPLFDSGRDWTYEDVWVQILLPEGAVVEEITLPPDWADSGEVTTGTVATYLDWTGRSAIWIRKTQVVDEHAADVYIAYKLNWWGLARKPLVVAEALMMLFGANMALSNIDFSISRS